MQIVIVQSPPLAEKHGVRKGRVFNIVSTPKGVKGIHIRGDTGDLIKLYPHEYRVIHVDKGVEDFDN